ncbi:MAG: hypothetical protein IPH33_10665 [Bacteroidetes bacterium]|nr:hypothetical protein [Bacteroidota bacterium]
MQRQFKFRMWQCQHCCLFTVEWFDTGHSCILLWFDNLTGTFNIMASDSISQSGFNHQDVAIPVESGVVQPVLALISNTVSGTPDINPPVQLRLSFGR